jgi:5-methylcytosine-specific restriction protein A
MLFTPLVEKNDVWEAFHLFADSMKKDSEPRNLKFGFQGDSVPNLEVFWNESLGIWSLFDPCNKDKLHQDSYWCPFGVKDPSKFPSQSSTCEINFPKKGINRRLKGIFVRDEEDKIYVTHNGAVGGGRKGIGKFAFLKYLSNSVDVDIIHVIWQDGKETNTICIGRLDDPELPGRVANYVHNVSLFKQNI